MNSIQFFHRDLPIVGNAPVIHFDEGNYKFWEIVNAKEERCLVFREMLGVVTLQERLDTFLKEEASALPQAAYKMIWAHHVRPARIEAFEGWALSHPKQMESFRA